MYIHKIKEEQKQLALIIRKKKSQRKELPNGYVPGLVQMRVKYRHRHIAYCIMRGTPYEKIEQPSENNRPNMNIVKSIIEEWSSQKEAA